MMAKRKAASRTPALIDKPDAIGSLANRRRRALFLPFHLSKRSLELAATEADQIEKAHAILVHWADLADQGRLAVREKTLDASFLHEVFGDALGYRTLTAGAGRYELEREFSVPGVGTADGALGDFSQEGMSPVAIIELKGAEVRLDLDRFNGRTPVQQCWDYLNAVPDCPWGIVSNFVSLRIYHRERGSRTFEQFTLRELRGRVRFCDFYCLLGPGGLLPTKLHRKPRALDILTQSGARQREVGDELYEMYSENRHRLVHHLHRERRMPIDRSIAVAQKIIDRIVLVAFCEDRGLLPEDTIRTAYEQLPPFARVTNPRWRNFVNLFHTVDRGHADINLENGYNGGLFRPDPAVDELELDDGWTDFFRNIGRFDFRDEVNVDVLGHLFEKSITELERFRAGALFGEEDPGGRPIMPRSAQRKRLGTYYTPAEFTSLLVGSTICDLLLERCEEAALRRKVDPQRRDNDPAAQVAWARDCLVIIRNLRVLDPACGSGAFLIQAYEYLEEQYGQIIDLLLAEPDGEELARNIPDMILADNLFGVDLSPEATEITQLALWIRSARANRTLADLSANIVCGNSLVADREVHPLALDWTTTFPAAFSREDPGFDVIIGNPPWERVKLQEREFFSLSAPDIAATVNAADRRRLVEALREQNPELHARYEQGLAAADATLTYARQSGRYPLTGKGDINTYALFAELACALLAPGGRAGLLVPSGIASDMSTKEFFAKLVDEKRLIKLYDFENKRAFFPDVHRSFKFSALVFGGGAAGVREADFVFDAHALEDLDPADKHIKLTKADFALMNPNSLTCPVFRTRRDADLTRTIYRRVPVLWNRRRKQGGNPWGVHFVRMFDQTNDAELFHSPKQLAEQGFKLHGNLWKRRREVFLPLYEAKMVQAFDHRAASVVIDPKNWMRQGQPERTSLVQHQNPEHVVQPRWWVPAAAVRDALGGDLRPAMLCYKDVTSPTNERTMIASFIPAAGVVNSAPLILCDEQVSFPLQACLLANLNSFALDYVARQKVGNVHLNFFIVEQLPIFALDDYRQKCPWNKRQTLERWISDRALKLTCTADDMRPLAEASQFEEGVHPWRAEDRAALRAELDAAFFILYGLGRNNVEYVLSTFSAAGEVEGEPMGGQSPADAILTKFDDLTERME